MEKEEDVKMMKRLTTEEIKLLSERLGANKVAVEDFLMRMTIGNASGITKLLRQC